MKRILATLVCAFVISIFGLSPAFAEEGETKTLFGDVLAEKGIDVSVSGSMDTFSKYVWRGFLLDDDWVFQPSFYVDVEGFKVGVWGNFDSDQDDALSSDEIDTIVSYSYTIDEKLTLTAGHTYYEFVSADTFSKEFFVSASVAVWGTPTLSAFIDYGDEEDGGGDGEYYALDLTHSFMLLEENGVTLDLGGHIGYNKEQYLAGEGWDILLSAGLGIPLTDNLKASLKSAYSIPFEDLEDSAIGNQDEEFYGGLSLAYSF